MAKLTKQNVMDILAGVASPMQMAEKYGVSRSAITKIRTGEMYEKVYAEYVEKNGMPPNITEPKRRRLTKDEVFYVLGTEDSMVEVTEKLQINSNHVSRIRCGKGYREYYEEYCKMSGKPAKRKPATRSYLGQAEVINILTSKKTDQDLADRYSVGVKTIRNIRSGKTHKAVHQYFNANHAEDYHGETWQATRMVEGAKRTVQIPALLGVPKVPMITQAWV
jgi:hypothetical protein